MAASSVSLGIRMKHLVNARFAIAVVTAGVFAIFVPPAAHAQTPVNASWLQSSASGPAARAAASIAYDSVHRDTVLFGGADGLNYFGDTWQFDGSSWRQLQVAGPSGRYLAPMVFDSARGVAVLYGGYSPQIGLLGDTWEWNGSGWNQKSTPQSPPTRLWTAMAYDSIHHVTVLFGGASPAGNSYSDTWEYDGSDWTQVVTAHSPPARRGQALAFDAARGRIVMFGGQDPNGIDLNDTWEFDGADWQQIGTAASPVPRQWHSMAYDPNLGGVVMFGGAIGNNLNAPIADTWLYDGTTWVQLFANAPWFNRFWAAAAYDSTRGDTVMFGGSNTALAPGGQVLSDTWSLQAMTTSIPDWGQATSSTAPSPRTFSQMDYDSIRGVSVVFGGSSDAGPGNLADTWTWNGSGWTRMTPTTSPPALAAGMMAYDSARGVSVLFGGSSNAGDSSATWEWDGTNWTLKTPATSPPPLVWGAMTYDSARGQMLLFGGDTNGGALLNQTWVYDGTNWTQLHPANSPTPRDGSALAFDPTRGRAVLFGGHDANGRLADTWEWAGTNWTQIPTSYAPAPRFWESMAFDSHTGRIVLFGGDHFLPYDLGESNDTWEWDGTQWSLDAPAAAPAVRSGQAMAYDANRDRVVVFGGWNAATSPATIYGDTWELGSGIQTAVGTAGGNLQLSGTTTFGNVNVGSSTQTTQTYAAFRLTNTGTGPLTVNSITASGADFPMTSYCPTDGNPLPAGSYCMTLVVFSPVAAGARAGSISFSFNAPGGEQTFQLQGTGVLNPTRLTVFAGSGLFNGTANIVAALASNGTAVAGQPVTLTLASGATTSIQTNSQGLAVWFNASLTGIHAGAHPTGIEASFAGSQSYAASSASGALTIVQPVLTSFAGDFYVSDTAAGHATIQVDQRTPASDPEFIDYAQTVVWARIQIVGPASTNTFFAQVNDATTWSITGLGQAVVSLPVLPDAAYTVIATLVDGLSFVPPSSMVASDDARAGLVSSPTKGGFVSAGGAIASDPVANTADMHGYFSAQLKPGSTPSGNVVYVFRRRMDVGGGNMRDVDVWVSSTDVTSLSGNSSTATAVGHFSVDYVDALTGQRYTAFEFSGGTYKLTLANATNKSPAGFGLVLKRPDGTIFDTTGTNSTAAVVLGTVTCHL
jgi:hypothetical protein